MNLTDRSDHTDGFVLGDALVSMLAEQNTKACENPSSHHLSHNTQNPHVEGCSFKATGSDGHKEAKC